MSHVALQRVMVRMLYDGKFASDVLRDPDQTLREVELSKEERSLLAHPDPRAWTIDPDRPRRSLTVLLQEYPTSFALVHRQVGLDPLQAFFSSPRFHAVVQERGSMACAFGDHLAALVDSGEVADSRVVALAGLEQATARLRRRPTPAPPRRGEDDAATATGASPMDTDTSLWRLSEDKALSRAPAGTADLHEEIHLRFAASEKGLVEAVLEPSIELPKTPLRAGEEALLLELACDDGPRVKFAVGAAEITEELYALLDFAVEPRAFSALCRRIIELGAGEDEAAEILEGLIGEAILTPVAPAH